jgi:hypothetical protein
MKQQLTTDEWLQNFNPKPDELLDVLLPQIDHWMLLEIARADYGKDVQEHLAPLKLFHEERALPLLKWHPAEVLELIRWSEPAETGWKPGDEGHYGHLLRAFACSTLLRARARPENSETYDSFGDTSIQLERSLVALGTPFIRPGARFFAWCIERLSSLKSVGNDRVFFGLALLSLTTKLPHAPENDLAALCEWIDDSVRASSYGEEEWIPSDLRGQKANRWAEVGMELSDWSGTQPPSEEATWVALIGSSLVKPQSS